MKITLPSGVIIEGEAAEITPMLASIVDHDIEAPIAGGDHEDKKLSADLKRSVAYNKLSAKNREAYDLLKLQKGPVQVVRLAEMLEITNSAMQGRLHTLKIEGLVDNPAWGLWEAL